VTHMVIPCPKRKSVTTKRDPPAPKMLNTINMPTSPNNTIVYITLGCALLLIGILVFKYGNEQNPYELTKTRLQTLEHAVRTHINAQGAPPTALSELGLPEEALHDHLGEPFRYEVSEHSVTILSYGSDKKPGGLTFRKDFKAVIEF